MEAENPYINDYNPTSIVNKSFNAQRADETDLIGNKRLKSPTMMYRNDYNLSSHVKLDQNPSSRSAIPIKRR